MIKDLQSMTDDAELRVLLKKAKYIKLRIKRMRKNGLEKDGEMSIGNIVFKCLRRNERLGGLMHLIVAINDKIDSI